jgi:hypothetical protein
MAHGPCVRYIRTENVTDYGEQPSVLRLNSSWARVYPFETPPPTPPLKERGEGATQDDDRSKNGKGVTSGAGEGPTSPPDPLQVGETKTRHRSAFPFRTFGGSAWAMVGREPTTLRAGPCGSCRKGGRWSGDSQPLCSPEAHSRESPLAARLARPKVRRSAVARNGAISVRFRRPPMGWAHSTSHLHRHAFVTSGTQA